MFVYKTFRSGGDVLLAIADASLVGKRLTSAKFDITVSEEFYSGSRCSKDEAIKLARRSTVINAIGKNIIKLFQENGLLEKNNVLMISGVPHAQIVVV